jgi:FlaA1/EpsC-like NDP-sugar epimerase
VANFSAHKHVRSEKDRYSVQALIENNDIKAKKFMDLLCEFPPKHFFCVSTDKAANPVNIMGASKRIMEDLVMAYNDKFKVTTARFANVAFSNGSLPDGWLHRMQKRQPLAAPSDVKRYFVSPEESGQICMLACILGNGGEVFFPKLGEDQMLTFSAICDAFVQAEGFSKKECINDEEAKRFAHHMSHDSETYPVVYFKSDTTGEKAYEEFYIPGERVNMERFKALGVIEETTRRPINELNAFFAKLETLFQGDFTKEEVVNAIKEFIPNFEHEEKGKNLDQKM